MKKCGIFIGLIVLGLVSCKQKEEQPAKVNYSKKETKTETSKKAESNILIADLPIQFPGVSMLLYPIGELTIPEEKNNRYAAENNFVVSNYSDYEITGYLSNIKFQKTENDSLVSLTDKPIMIESATYLKTIADKLKKQFIVYIAETQDSNQDGKVDSNDVKELYISNVDGSNFMRLSLDVHEVADWKVIESQNRLYFRTIEDINKNGIFDKDDTIHYNYVDLTAKELKAIEFKPV